MTLLRSVQVPEILSHPRWLSKFALGPQAGATSVEMVDVANTLRNQSPLKKPGHATRVGVGSVVLPLLPNKAGTINNPNPSEPGMLATFSIHVGKTFTKAEVEDLGAWLASIPKVKSASLRLESIKQTQSMFLSMRLAACPIIESAAFQE
ncbi:hypothetical protein LOZ66_006493 [Ophidiomyces ophidiicola]|nr:hypothetical protein LOZ66_006493 [Ophidiomyces ophidiicola]